MAIGTVRAALRSVPLAGSREEVTHEGDGLRLSGVPLDCEKTPAFFFGVGETLPDVSALIEGRESRFNQSVIFNFRS